MDDVTDLGTGFRSWLLKTCHCRSIAVGVWGQEHIGSFESIDIALGCVLATTQEASCATDALSSPDSGDIDFMFPLEHVKSGFHDPSCVVRGLGFACCPTTPSNTAASSTQRASKGFWWLTHQKSVTLSIGNPLCPYPISYRRAYGLFTSGLFWFTFCPTAPTRSTPSNSLYCCL
jgi:hypothetical protein